MKSYVSDRQIRLVGKAWEVKHQLNKMLQQAGQDTTVADYITRLNRGAGRNSGSSLRTLPYPAR